MIKHTKFLLQLAAAAEIEARVNAKMKELEKQGIVRRCQDSYEILDVKKYNEAMGNKL